MGDAWRNGFYGVSTRALVVGLKRDLGLPATALVTDRVWAAQPLDSLA